MYKKILVPLDGSKRAEAILPHVEELAHNFEAQIVFLHVIDPHHSSDEIASEMNTKFAKLYLNGLIGEFQEKGIKVKSLVENGSVSHTILNVAKRDDIDLIAMASHGRTGLAHVFYGSVAASVLHLVDRPLLLVRAED